MRPGDMIRHNHTTLVFVVGGFRVVKTLDLGIAPLYWTDKDGNERQCTATVHAFTSKPNANVSCVKAVHTCGKDAVLMVNGDTALVYGMLFDVKITSKIGVVIRPRVDSIGFDWWWNVGSYGKDALRITDGGVQDPDTVGPHEYEEIRQHEWYL